MACTMLSSHRHRPRFVVVSIVAFVSMIVSEEAVFSAGPPQSSADALHQHAQQTLSSVDSELTTLRSSLYLAFVGKEIDPNGERQYVRVTKANVDKIFEDVLGTNFLDGLHRDRHDLETDYAAVSQKRLRAEEFSSNTYARVESALESAWEVELAQVHVDYTNLGWNDIWRAQMDRLGDKHSGEKSQLEHQLDASGASTDERDAKMAALVERQSTEDHQLFRGTANQYENLLGRLQDFRARWIRSTWEWAYFALALAEQVGDVHDRAQKKFRLDAFRLFGDRYESDLPPEVSDTRVGFFNAYPGSWDRLITAFHDEWCGKGEFPHIQPADQPCVLRMTELARVPVLQLRPAPPAPRTGKSTFEGAPPKYTPGEVITS